MIVMCPLDDDGVDRLGSLLCDADAGRVGADAAKEHVVLLTEAIMEGLLKFSEGEPEDYEAVANRIWKLKDWREGPSGMAAMAQAEILLGARVTFSGDYPI